MRILYTLLDILPAAIVLLPLLAVWGRIRHWNWKQILLRLLFCCYLCAVFSMVGLPNLSYIRFQPNINLIPLIGIPEDLKNSLLNILLFLPLGCFLPLLWDDQKNLPKAIYFGLILSLTIELLQMFTGRATDVNDLLTNTLGILPGFYLARIFPKIPGTAKQEAKLLVLFSFCLMFLLQPLGWHLLY